MAAYLLFRLYGPMAAWGEMAVGEYRPAFGHPSKSAVIGLVAAALGITRDDEAAQGHLAQGYGMAVRVEAPGSLLRDYHTSQVPPTTRGTAYRTRRDEVRATNLNTILSSRDYRCDALATVCLWPLRDDAPYSLQDLRQALERPRFVLYLGRKSCPPALPLQPRVVEGQSLSDAFAKAEGLPKMLEGLRRAESVSLFWEGEVEAGIPPQQTFVRRDVLLSSRRRQFAERREHHATLAREDRS